MMFFVDGSNTASAVFEPQRSNLLSELAYYEPCSLEIWIALSRIGDRDTIEELVKELVDMGLVAWV